MRILITGAQGMVGGDLCDVARAAGHDVLAMTRGELDITNEVNVKEQMKQLAPDAVVNCAAYNFVDKVEDPAIYPIAYAINALGPKYLAQACAQHNIPFVHLSTDFVFDGQQHEGYVETDLPRPLNKYAETKYAGELFTQEAGGTWYVARVSRVFGRKGAGQGAKESFVDMALRWAKEKPEVTLTNEQENMATYSPDIAEAILRLLTEKFPAGIYHLVNEGPGITPYTWGLEIYAAAGLHPIVKAVPASFFPGAPARPPFSVLLNTKFPPLRPRIEALREYLSQRAI